MEKQLYQCPYSRATTCNMEYSCKGCEDFKPMKLQFMGLEPENKLHIIPNNPESGNTRMFLSSRHCQKCSPNTAFSNDFVLEYFKVIPDVIICCLCGHEQKITK